MAGDIMKSMANKVKEAGVGSYMTDRYNEEWEASQKNKEDGWLINQLRSVFKDAKTTDAFKSAIKDWKEQMLWGKTPKERGEARKALNAAITAWKTRKEKDLSYGETVSSPDIEEDEEFTD